MFDRNRLTSYLYGFAPRSALMCLIDGDAPPGDGGAPPATTQPPPAVTQPATPVFTPEQLAYIAAETTRVSNAAAAAARREAMGRQAKPGGESPQAPARNEPPAPPPNVHDLIRAETTRIRAFERAAGQYGLSPDALAILEQDFNTASPQDPAAWVGARAAAFGWKAGGATTATQPAAPNGSATPAAGTMPPPPMPGGAAPARVIDADAPIMSRSRADQAALAKQLGPFEFKARLMRELAESGQRFPLRR